MGCGRGTSWLNHDPDPAPDWATSRNSGSGSWHGGSSSCGSSGPRTNLPPLLRRPLTAPSAPTPAAAAPGARQARHGRCVSRARARRCGDRARRARRGRRRRAPARAAGVTPGYRAQRSAGRRRRRQRRAVCAPRRVESCVRPNARRSGAGTARRRVAASSRCARTCSRSATIVSSWGSLDGWDRRG